MVLTKKSLSRRAVLRGMGAAVALPLLDAMVPAATALSKTAAAPVRRFGVVYVPNGMAMEYWTPATEGTGFEFTQVLKPLEPYRDQLNVISGLNSARGGAHAGASTGFLTGVQGESSSRKNMASVSLDQLAATELGKQTQLASLELGLDGAAAGTCDGLISCTLTNTISWRTATTALPMESNPRAVFERLFGDDESTDSRVRLAGLRRDRSILDSVTGVVAALQRAVSPGDRAKIDEYLEAVRDVERRVQTAEKQIARELPVAEQPAGVPGSYDEHAKLMFDLQVLAYQADLTRVITFMLGREFSGRTYPQIGVSEAHHPLSHHGQNPGKIATMAKVNTYHVSLFAYYVEKLRSTQDGEGSLLDHAILLYGAGMSNSNFHLHDNLPLVLVGGGSGQLSGFGRHLVYKDVPTGNLHVTLLDKLGVPVEKFGNSTGKVTRDMLLGV